MWNFIQLNIFFSSLVKSITTAGHCAGSSGGRPYWYPPPLGAPFTHTTPLMHIAEIWLGSNQQPLNPWGSAHTCEPQISCLEVWRNLYFTIHLYVSFEFQIKYQIKALKLWCSDCVQHSEVGFELTTPVHPCVWLATSTTVAFTMGAGVWGNLLDIMQYLRFLT